MTKKGQVQYVFLYILAGLVIVALFLFGYTTMSRLSDLDKRSALESFEFSVQERVSRVIPSPGTEEINRFSLGHGLTRVFVVDTSKDVLQYFKGSSVINNSIKSGAKRNVFVFSGTRLEKSFYLEGAEVDFPYYLCADVIDGGFMWGFRGTGDSAVLRNADLFQDCGIRSILEEIVMVLYPGEDIDARIDEFIEELESALSRVREQRMIERDLIRNQTHVTVTLQALEDIERYRHIEIIAKCLAHHVSDVDFHDNPPDRIIREDPLIMWEFHDIKKGGSVSIEYTVEQLIDELCMRELQSLQSSVNGAEKAGVSTIAADVSPPEVTLEGPADGESLAGTIVQYRFKATDGSGIAECTLKRNGVGILSDPSIESGEEQSFIEGQVPVGNHYWLIECKDKAGNIGPSDERMFTVSGSDTTPPSVSFISPSMGEVIDEAPVMIIYKAADSESGISRCSLFRNGDWIMTDSTITPGVPQKFSIAMAPGPYTIRVLCTDDSPSENEGSSEEVSFTYVVT